MSLQFILIGLLAGLLSGILGVGGGVIVVPALVFIFGFTQAKAQGTTLAMLVPPIGVLAAYVYYNEGLVDLATAAFLCFGFVIGGYIGAKYAVSLPHETLSRIFGLAIILIGAKMLLS